MTVGSLVPGGESGNPVSSRVLGQLGDLRGSVHDPNEDILLPSKLKLEKWLSDEIPTSELADIVVRQTRERVEAQATAAGGSVEEPAGASPKAEHTLTSVSDSGYTGRSSALAARTAPGEANPAVVSIDINEVALRRLAEESATYFEGLRHHFLKASTEAVDLRAPWFTIGDQGRDASCVGHAIADLIERQRRVAFDPPSVRFIWQAAKEMDPEPERPTTMLAGAGTSLRSGLHVIKKFGYATESEVPTDSHQLYQGNVDDFFAALGRRKAGHLVNLGTSTKAWLAWLSSGRPIVAHIRVGDAFLATGLDEEIAPEIDDELCFSHAVLLMGYEFEQGQKGGTVRDMLQRLLDTKREDDELLQVRYLVRNSAGRDWGNDGYAWMPQRVLCAQGREGYGLLWPDDEDELKGQKVEKPKGPAAA